MTDRTDNAERDLAQWALRERVKELTCLYGIARVADKTGIPLEEVVQHVVELLPPAWQYPEVACARITFEGRECCSAGFVAGGQSLASEILIDGAKRGQVELVYVEERPRHDEGPFLKEERSLINEVARQMSLILARRQAEEDRARLQEQLRRVDRLATIGQLAAGVAHELNEPLGAILGYAQLTLKGFGIPDQMSRNLEKIVKASLHSREIIRKLLLFARQVPSEKRAVDLNQMVKESLYLVETRCAKAKVQLVLRLAKDLPAVPADPGQMQQVMLNLAVNAVQSMPSGGTLRVITERAEGHVRLAVEDTGVGMEPEVVAKIFNPFFTTKDVGQGTGLGLSMVHGIVTAHGGTVEVQSLPGKGTRFDVLLPLAAGGAPLASSGDRA